MIAQKKHGAQRKLVELLKLEMMVMLFQQVITKIKEKFNNGISYTKIEQYFI